MDALNWALVWMAGAGAVGGALNALVAGDLRLWPWRVASAAGPKLFRPGLVVSILIGAGLSAGTFWAFSGATGVRAAAPGGRGLLETIVALVIGALGARAITDEADKRLLRAAACKAAAAPAADPTTIQEMELASPHAVLKRATALEPRRTTLR